MKIRAKIFLVVLPLITVTLFLSQMASYFRAVNGITRVAQQFLSFKASELRRYAENQWELLAENNYDSRPDMAAAAKAAVIAYAAGMELSDTELTLALAPRSPGGVAASTKPVVLAAGEEAPLLALLEEESEGLREAVIGGKLRVFSAFYAVPFGWYLLLTEEKSVFYADARSITTQTAITLALSLAAAAALLALFARHLTNPLARVIEAMNGIIAGGDLHGRVPVEYRDETGHLALTFNTMITELDRAYEEIKRHAFRAVLAQKKEQRIRTIFQKYVPKDLIDKFFASPESMLVGDNRVLAILFSDIRSFTTISEGLAPDELVQSLNRYFSGQVDIIMNRGGIVDKYIGDAIMAFWGAPVRHDDDALQSVLSGLDMLDSVEEFNRRQKAIGKTEFHVGIGINYGAVTVGNIGSDRKMDYTVIGDMVNLASRMEGLTKTYHEEILISESLCAELEKLAAALPLRLLDTVAVKGKTRGVKIYTVRRGLASGEAAAWTAHNEGMARYYRREFDAAAACFEETLRLLPGDFNAANLLGRCRAYALTPPPETWDGVEVMTSK
ncbi:MAG: adenylate/guanylate cyclase domain-containing protein [Treponema sp.]|jgi:class 3 adenylate cyclase/HAMP domain-containing protein|nr:adenylate/guanylate cyclase domain-containing protein [Treponema sp.]